MALFVGLVMCSGFVVTANRYSWQPNQQTAQQQQQKQNQATEKKKSYVDYDAELIEKVENDTIIRLIGNVIFHHNGVIIQCDSSYRYNDNQMDCFGNVIINQDSTYIYGDKVVYDGYVNMARVFSPLIKITNGTETVMYTYNLTFDTKTKIGEYSGGGVVTQRDNMMESERGFFYVDLNEVKLMDSVSMKNKDYKVQTDSLRFNLDTEVTTFLTRTYIWDSDHDFITSKSGKYEHKTRTYIFTDNAYIMTPDQESWADSVIYKSLTKEAFMKRNIQILDTTQNTLAFGDWGYYNDSIKKSILANKASIRSWEVKKEADGTVKADTAYIRSDSIYIETFPLGTSKKFKDADENDDREELDSVVAPKMGMTDGAKKLLNKLQPNANVSKSDSLSKRDSSVVQPIVATSDSVSNDGKVALLQADSVSGGSIVQQTERAQIASGGVQKVDSVQQPLSDSLDMASVVRADSSKMGDVAKMDSLAVADSAAVVVTKKGDTVERILRAFRRVEMYRKDFQGRCDSLVGYSVDSTMSMFGAPVLWNENNQITSTQIDVYTLDEQADWADFIGDPIVAQRLDSTHYNQATGKQMQVYFKDNEIYRSVLSGNVVNFYYSEEDKEIVSFDKIESAELEIVYENREPVTMKWFGQGEWVMYPIDQIPPGQSQRLEGFSWITEGRAKSSRDICSRVVKESLRAKYQALPQPIFRIESKIRLYKEQLLNAGEWHDRNDIPTYTPEYFQNVDERLK